MIESTDEFAPSRGIRATSDLMRIIADDCASRYPEEACGILIGTPGNLAQVVEVRPAANVWDGEDEKNRRYLLDPRAQLAAERDAASVGRAVIGFYHSHPDAAPVPSERDRAAAWPVYIYLIVNVTAGKVGDSRAWTLDPDETAFRPVLLQIT